MKLIELEGLVKRMRAELDAVGQHDTDVFVHIQRHHCRNVLDTPLPFLNMDFSPECSGPLSENRIHRVAFTGIAGFDLPLTPRS